MVKLKIQSYGAQKHKSYFIHLVLLNAYCLNIWTVQGLKIEKGNDKIF